MFGLDWWELMVIGAVALVVIGPRELPDALYVLGRWVNKARSYAREFQNQFDELMREAEVKRMREEWNNNILEKEKQSLEAELAATARAAETTKVQAVETPKQPPGESKP